MERPVMIPTFHWYSFMTGPWYIKYVQSCSLIINDLKKQRNLSWKIIPAKLVGRNNILSGL
jgi:hypothetical protein